MLCRLTPLLVLCSSLACVDEQPEGPPAPDLPDAGTDAMAAPTPQPCEAATRVGGFEVRLVDNSGEQPFTSIGGSVRNGVTHWSVWVEVARYRDCRLIVAPTLICQSPCAINQVCAGEDRCID